MRKVRVADEEKAAIQRYLMTNISNKVIRGLPLLWKSASIV